MSQQTKENEVPPSVTIPGNLNLPVPLPPNSAQPSAEPKQKLTSHVEADSIHTTPSPESKAYLESSILPVIRANWYQLLSKSGEKAGGDATIEFAIAKDGSVTATKLIDGSGHAALGDLAIKAVTKAGSFSTLPASIPSFDVRARFSYQPEANDQNANNVPVGLILTCNNVVGTSCITPPQVTFSSLPENSHPAGAGAAKYSGTAYLQLTVTTDGKPADIKVLKGLGSGLDEKAIAAVRTWRFVPAKKDGKPVPAQIVVEVEFHLYDNDK